MGGIYVFTAGNKAARAHLADSISSAVPLNRLHQHLPTKDATDLESIVAQPDGFYAWGAVSGERNVPNWQSLAPGDTVLTVYDNRYRFISSVLAKVHNEDLARSIWGSDEEGRTWEYIYFLTKPTRIDVNVDQADVVKHLRNGYRGFTKISDAAIEKIEKEYGTVENFCRTIFTVFETAQFQIKLVEDALPPEAFDSSNLSDARNKVLRTIVQRRGQKKFRDALLAAYGGKCAVTQCAVVSTLEAAHIVPYLGEHTNQVVNGLLLRSDIHTLFDLGLLRIGPDLSVSVDPACMQSPYSSLHGQKLVAPENPAFRPSADALSTRLAVGV